MFATPVLDKTPATGGSGVTISGAFAGIEQAADHRLETLAKNKTRHRTGFAEQNNTN